MTDDKGAGDHDRFTAELPELATGVLGDPERAALLSHVDGCQSCADELGQLMATADSLVLLASEVEPPVGFETRLMERLQIRAAHRPRDHWQRRSLAVASVAAAAIAAFGIGWATHPTGGQPAGNAIIGPGAYSSLAEAPLVSGGRSHGTVTVYDDEQGWLLMTVDSSTWSGSVQCRVISKDGKALTLGSFRLVSGRGAWVAALPTSVEVVRVAELIGAGGRVLASAQLS